MTLDARSTMGTLVTLEIYGIVRDARGLTSITYNSLCQTRYWMLTRPLVPSASVSFCELSTMVCIILSLML